MSFFAYLGIFRVFDSFVSVVWSEISDVSTKLASHHSMDLFMALGLPNTSGHLVASRLGARDGYAYNIIHIYALLSEILKRQVQGVKSCLPVPCTISLWASTFLEAFPHISQVWSSLGFSALALNVQTLRWILSCMVVLNHSTQCPHLYWKCKKTFWFQSIWGFSIENRMYINLVISSSR